MTADQYARLERAIRNWIDYECETDEWSSVITGDDTVRHMAAAARHVLDACEESQKFGVREGLLP